MLREVRAKLVAVTKRLPELQRPWVLSSMEQRFTFVE